MVLYPVKWYKKEGGQRILEMIHGICIRLCSSLKKSSTKLFTHCLVEPISFKVRKQWSARISFSHVTLIAVGSDSPESTSIRVIRRRSATLPNLS